MQSDTIYFAHKPQTTIALRFVFYEIKLYQRGTYLFKLDILTDCPY